MCKCVRVSLWACTCLCARGCLCPVSCNVCACTCVCRGQHPRARGDGLACLQGHSSRNKHTLEKVVVCAHPAQASMLTEMHMPVWCERLDAMHHIVVVVSCAVCQSVTLVGNTKRHSSEASIIASKDLQRYSLVGGAPPQPHKHACMVTCASSLSCTSAPRLHPLCSAPPPPSPFVGLQVKINTSGVKQRRILTLDADSRCLWNFNIKMQLKKQLPLSQLVQACCCRVPAVFSTARGIVVRLSRSCVLFWSVL